MDDIQLFDFENSEVRIFKINGEAWFIGKDIAKILGYEKERKAILDHVDEEDRMEKIVNLSQASQNTANVKYSQVTQNRSNVNNSQDQQSEARSELALLINESGVYSLIFASKLPNAKKFKHWVTSEVLPAIRKTGYYQIPQTPEERLALTMKATIHLDSRVTKVEKAVADIQDKAEVDEGQRYQLLQARKSKVISACGGVDSNYYVEKKARKVFSEFGRDFKKAFHIPRYDCLKDKKFDEAMTFTKNWYPSFVLQREIQNVNAQSKLDLLRKK